MDKSSEFSFWVNTLMLCWYIFLMLITPLVDNYVSWGIVWTTICLLLIIYYTVMVTLIITEWRK